MAFSGNQLTRLGPSGIPRGNYGTFTAKALGAVTIYVAFGNLTRLTKGMPATGPLDKATPGPSTLKKAAVPIDTLET